MHTILMTTDDLLRKLEGLQTIETAAKTLGTRRQSTLNLLSRLKKEGYVTTTGGGKQKRLYKITMRKQLPRAPGMFDILNKYNPDFKLNPWFDHQVHGKYTVEDALLDAIETKSFRVILASLRLFNHITDWKGLYRGGKERNLWNNVGALYEVARLSLRAKKMPIKYHHLTKYGRKISLIPPWQTKEGRFKSIENFWGVAIPFREGDLRKGAS